jgi:hypothetical protein
MGDEKLDHDSAAEKCWKEHKHSRLLTVGSLRKFQHVEMEYLSKVVMILITLVTILFRRKIGERGVGEECRVRRERGERGERDIGEGDRRERRERRERRKR